MESKNLLHLHDSFNELSIIKNKISYLSHDIHEVLEDLQEVNIPQLPIYEMNKLVTASDMLLDYCKQFDKWQQNNQEAIDNIHDELLKL